MDRCKQENSLVAVELHHAHFGWCYPFKSLTVLLSACHIRFVNRRANRLIRFNPTGLSSQLFLQRLPERMKVCQRHQGRTRQFVLRPNLLTLVRAQIAAKVFEQHNYSLDSAASFGVFRFVPVNGWPIHGCSLMRFVQIIRLHVHAIRQSTVSKHQLCQKNGFLRRFPRCAAATVPPSTSWWPRSAKRRSRGRRGRKWCRNRNARQYVHAVISPIQLTT